MGKHVPLDQTAVLQYASIKLEDLSDDDIDEINHLLVSGKPDLKKPIPLRLLISK